MKLPKKGMLVRADGTIAWMWSHPVEETDAVMIPPITYDPITGVTESAGQPGDVIVNLDNALDPEDMLELHGAHHNLRFKKDANNRFTLTQLHKTRRNGQPEIIEQEHYLNSKLQPQEKPPVDAPMDLRPNKKSI